MGIQLGDHSATVLEAFRAGDEQALAEIYIRWSPLVYSIALYSLGSVSEAEVVTQRVFTDAWTSRSTADPAPAGLSAWLISLTQQRIAEAQAAGSNQIGSRDRIASVTQTDNKTEPADLAVRLVLADEVSRLDAEPQQVLRMALHDDLTHTQIAKSMGLPSGTVTAHIRHSLLNLRKGLGARTGAH